MHFSQALFDSYPYRYITCPVPNGVQETAEIHPDQKWDIQPQKG